MQHDLAGQLPLTHIGRAEHLGDTFKRLYEHTGTPAPQTVARRNETSLDLAPHAYDERTAATVRRHYWEDFDAFGYDDTPPDAGPAAEWEARAEAALPLLHATIDEHVRVGQLHRLAQRRAERMQVAEAKAQAESARRVGAARSPLTCNLEGEADFNVRWGWAEGPPEPGIHRGRARQERGARAAVDAAAAAARGRPRVLVDNGSTDGTAATWRARDRRGHGGGRRSRSPATRSPSPAAATSTADAGGVGAQPRLLLQLVVRPRAHELRAQMGRRHGPRRAGRAALRDLAWQLEGAEAIVRVPRIALYVADDRLGYRRPRAAQLRGVGLAQPARLQLREGDGVGAADVGPEARSVSLPSWCVELKFLDGDEFAHWSPTNFDASPRTARKRREQEVFRALAAGARPRSASSPCARRAART